MTPRSALRLATRLSIACCCAVIIAAPVRGETPDRVPVPAENPRRMTAPENGQAEQPEAGEAEPADPAPPAPDEPALARCEAELKALGAVFERKDAIDGPGSCGLSATYEVSEIVAGVSLAPATQMRCATALATARWISQVVEPAARAFGDNIELTGIRQASTYACRTRNSQPDAKLSEHALGNAIDIRQFEFTGHDPLLIAPRTHTGSMEEAFQRAVRGGACLHFTTVLGPGSDGFHDDHLHLDLARRSRGYRLCQ